MRERGDDTQVTATGQTWAAAARTHSLCMGRTLYQLSYCDAPTSYVGSAHLKV